MDAQASMEPEPKVAERAVLAGALAVKELREAPPAPAAFDAALRPGDTLTVVIGAETYYPVKFNGFTVGPLSATTVIRPDEKAGDAYSRVHRYLSVLFETELQIKRQQFKARLGEAE